MGAMGERHGESYPRGALVTGAARRIGRALALDLAAQGWAVAVHFNRSDVEALSLVDEIRRSGGHAEALAADLSQEAESGSLVARAAAAVGPLGLLVNNASVFEYDDLGSASRASWDLHLETNLRAPLVLTQTFAAALPPLTSGLVVNVIDARVLHPTPRHLSYTVSKAGLWALTQALAQALAPRVRVNAIGPGPVLPSAGQTAADFATRCAGLPLRRPASPAEIAAALRFLIAAKSMTGQLLALDGGDHLTRPAKAESLQLPRLVESV